MHTSDMSYREPYEFPQSQGEGVCPECHLKYDDLTFTWHGNEACAECPECGDDMLWNSKLKRDQCLCGYQGKVKK